LWKTYPVEQFNLNTLWSVLIEQNQIEHIITWIDNTYSVKEKSSNNELEFPVSKELTQDMIDMIKFSKTLLNENKEVLLNHLSRRVDFNI
jgi:hypothetical protein